jgi:hypothetical protein
MLRLACCSGTKLGVLRYYLDLEDMEHPRWLLSLMSLRQA